MLIVVKMELSVVMNKFFAFLKQWVDILFEWLQNELEMIYQGFNNICTFILEIFNSLFYSSFIMENMNKIFSLNSI